VADRDETQHKEVSERSDETELRQCQQPHLHSHTNSTLWVGQHEAHVRDNAVEHCCHVRQGMEAADDVVIDARWQEDSTDYVTVED